MIEAQSPDAARALEPLRKVAEERPSALPGVVKVSALLTAHGPATARSPAGGTAAPGAGAH